MAPVGEAVYATLLMNDGYLPGAMVLGHSLKDKGASARLVVLATFDTLSPSTITELKTVYDEVIPINSIRNKHPSNLYLMDRPDLISTFTKIELWRQTQFSRIVYLDADTVALRAPNELLTHPAEFAAVPDIGWPDCFNSGLLVLNPNLGDYYSLLALAQRGISFDGADQGLLNMHFQDWTRLSFTYNCTPSGNYQYVPAYRHFQSSINVVHFIGREKPWTMGRDHKYTSGAYGELLGRWWSTYDKHYRAHTYYSNQAGGQTRVVQNLVAGEKTTPVHIVSSSLEAVISDQPDHVERLDNKEFEPVPTQEQRRFSAPQAEWDASRASPTPGGKPEAAYLPSQTYEFTNDTTLFQPPKYAEAPKNMWYQVPPKAEQSAALKPIFPWEERAPKPTRVFPREDMPRPEPASESTSETISDSTVRQTRDASFSSDATRDSLNSSMTEGDPWNTYSRTNAWDAMPDIERYVQALHVQQRRGKVQVLHRTPVPTDASQEEGEESAFAERRPSMKLTDFPTEFERPSLPVTPAPRRPSFWGKERDESGQLPTAEGVPNQNDWVSHPLRAFASAILNSPLQPIFSWRCQYCGQQNPIQRLEELQKKQTEVLEKGPNLDAQELPKRDMPENAVKDSPPNFAANAIDDDAQQSNATLEDTEDDIEFLSPTTITASSQAPLVAPLPRAQPKKGILKTPSFEVGFEPPEDDSEGEPAESVRPVQPVQPAEIRGTDSAEYAIA